jgi:hypothetical protein
MFFNTLILFSVVNQLTGLLAPLIKILPQKVKTPYIEDITIVEIIIAIVIALFCRAITLHDRISDFCGIRQKFDIEEILIPLAEKSGINITPENRQVLKEKRSALMRLVFYNYASSTDPKIDKHLIYKALDHWSWFWVIVENSTIYFLIAGILIYRGHHEVGFVLLLMVLPLVFVALPFCYVACRQAVHLEIDAILHSNKRALEIQGVLKSALPC